MRQIVKLGGSILFTPAQPNYENDKVGRPRPRKEWGTVIYINGPHRYFTVEREVHGHRIRESKKLT